MLALSFYLGIMLRNMGATVKFTRTSDNQNPSLEERGSMAAGADLFLSMHSDASDNPLARGVTSYYSVQRPESERFAADIGMAAADAMGNQFRGTIARPYPDNSSLDYYGVLRSAVAAGAKDAFIIEHGFHTNYEDCQALSNHETLLRIAEEEARVIGEYYGLVPGTICVNFPYTVKEGDSLYKIGQMFGVSWQSIAMLNNITYPHTIQTGQLVIIPLCGYRTYA